MDWLNLILTIVVSTLGAFATSLLALGKYREKVDRIEKDLDNLKKEVSESSKIIAKYEVMISNIEKNIDRISGVAQSHSPLALTEKGKRLVEKSGFMDIFEKIKGDLIKDLEKEKPKTQYEVQEKARIVMSRLFDDVRFKEVEKWAYENGEDLAQILRAGAIPLRDYYFEKHPNIVNPKEKY